MKLDIRDRNTQIGLGLVAVGLLALFGNLGLFGGLGQVLGLLLFVGAGVLVLRAYGDDPQRVWTLPIGFGLVGLGLASLDMPWSGGAFLGFLGLGFLAIWAVRREQWWAIIPGGVLLTLGLTATYDEWLRPNADAGGTIFFLGLAATFAVLYLLPSVNQRWAIWPALGLAVVGVLTIGYRGGWVLPAILIGVGAWMLSRQSRPSEVPPRAPGDGGTGPDAVGPAPSGPTAGATSEGPNRAPTSSAPGTGAHDVSPADDAAVRTTAHTPSTGAVQPTPRPETPDAAAEREVEEEAARSAASDLPPYGQEPAGWVEDAVAPASDGEPRAGDEEARGTGPRAGEPAPGTVRRAAPRPEDAPADEGRAADEEERRSND